MRGSTVSILSVLYKRLHCINNVLYERFFHCIYRNLSNHIKHMKEHKFFSKTQAPPTTEGVEPTTEEALKQRNSSLQGRVHVLQEHNRRLEGCISQLKLISEMVNIREIRGQGSERT